MVKVEIILKDDVFYAGDNIEGVVRFEFSKEKVCNSLRVEITGHTKIYQGKNHREKTSILSKWAELLPEKNLKLTAGEHKFPFKFELPHRLPQSRSEKNWCRTSTAAHEYFCKAALDDSSLLDSKCSVELKVKRRDYSNYYPKLCNPVTKQAVNASFFNQDNSVTVSATIPYAGIAQFEVIPITLKIDNKSDKNVAETKIKLIEAITLDKYCAKARLTENILLRNQIATPVRANDSETFTHELRIPEFTQISDIIYSKKFQVTHAIVLKAGGAELFFPIVIGSTRHEEGFKEQNVSPADDEALTEHLESKKLYNLFLSFLCG